MSQFVGSKEHSYFDNLKGISWLYVHPMAAMQAFTDPKRMKATTETKINPVGVHATPAKVALFLGSFTGTIAFPHPSQGKLDFQCIGREISQLEIKYGAKFLPKMGATGEIVP